MDLNAATTTRRIALRALPDREVAHELRDDSHDSHDSEAVELEGVGFHPE